MNSRNISWTDAIIGLSALLGVVAILTNTLGFVSLLFPMMREYKLSFSTGWMYVSKVSIVEVAGYGIISLLWPPIVFGLGPFLFVLVLNIIGRRLDRSLSSERHSNWRRDLLGSWIMAYTFLLLIVSVALVQAASSAETRGDIVITVLLLLAFLFSFAGGYSIMNRAIHPHKGTYLPYVKDRRALLGGFTVMFGSFVILSFGSVILSRDLPLPCVVMSSEEIIEGRLLAHSEGHWHTLQNSGTLKSVPDGEIETVKIVPLSDAESISGCLKKS